MSMDGMLGQLIRQNLGRSTNILQIGMLILHSCVGSEDDPQLMAWLKKTMECQAQDAK